MNQRFFVGSVMLLLFVTSALAQTKTQARPPAGTTTAQPAIPQSIAPSRPADPPGMTRSRKLVLIDYEIAWHEGRESKGGWLILGGIGSALLGGATLMGDEPNWASYSVLNGAGVILITWGSVMRWNAQTYLLHLRVKRYDFTMLPLYVPEQGQALGFAMVGRF